MDNKRKRKIELKRLNKIELSRNKLKKQVLRKCKSNFKTKKKSKTSLAGRVEYFYTKKINHSITTRSISKGNSLQDSGVNLLNLHKKNSLTTKISKSRLKKFSKSKQIKFKKRKNIGSLKKLGSRCQSVNFNHNRLKYITDITTWLKKSKEKKDKKVFIVSRVFEPIKHLLLQRGWVQNEDFNSSCFHLKFVLGKRLMAFDQLKNFQIVNKFKGVECLTTKSGLSQTVKNMLNWDDEDHNSFFPKCFDLSKSDEFFSFLDEYKVIHAENILKRFVNEKNPFRINCQRFDVDAALKVTMRRLKRLNDFVDFGGVFDDFQVTKSEWKNLNLNFVNSPSSRKSTKISFYGSHRQSEKQIFARKVLSKISKISPQFFMNGSRNIWILKPSSLSRGRGITVASSLSEILKLIKNRENSFVIQKYIEKPLLFKGKKFDIRQWVFITSWNPLEIWIYDEFYIRVASRKFNINQIKDLFSHLTNNSVNKKNLDYEEDECFLSQEEFKNWMDEIKKGKEYTKILKQIEDQVRWSLSCGQEKIKHRENTCEFFGFDFSIDEDFKVWLIEINSSPDFTFSSVKNYFF